MMITDKEYMCVFLCVLQYEYDTDETGDRVVLGRGTYGVVYAGRDLSNQVRIAIKEIPERDSMEVCPFQLSLCSIIKLRVFKITSVPHVQSLG